MLAITQHERLQEVIFSYVHFSGPKLFSALLEGISRIKGGISRINFMKLFDQWGESLWHTLEWN